jgi:hypothetical protein
MDTNKYLSRNWLLALLFGLTGCAVFAFTTKLTGGEFVNLAIGLTGIFRAGDAAVNWIQVKRQESANESPSRIGADT